MATMFLIAGPPTDAPLWHAVEKRLRSHGIDARAIPLFTHPDSDGSVRFEAEQLARLTAEQEGPCWIAAHGTALPIALNAAKLQPPEGLILSNGPIAKLDPISRGLARAASLPRWLGRRAFSPRIMLPWLRSSVGMRRAVVNPYVMDRDTTVAVCGPLFGQLARRERVRAFYQGLPEAVKKAPTPTVRSLLCWGGDDPVYPPLNASFLDSIGFSADTITIDGGHHLHPIERPWAMADEIAQWIEIEATTT